MHQEKLVVEGGIASCELRFRPNVHLVSVVRKPPPPLPAEALKNKIELEPADD